MKLTEEQNTSGAAGDNAGETSAHEKPQIPAPHHPPATTDDADLAQLYRTIRRATEALCEPLVADDYVIQSMPDASPVNGIWATPPGSSKRLCWHSTARISTVSSPIRVLFNSYYNAVGPRWPA